MKVEIGNATLYLGDCMDILPTLPKVDAVITDPPYGISLNTDYSKLKGSTKTFEPIHGDDKEFNPSLYLSLGVPCAFFGADHFHHYLPAGGTWHIWDKRPQSKSNMFADFESWWTSWSSGPSRIFRYQWVCGVHPGSTPERIDHPTVKPVSVMAAVIESTKFKTILDPFMGSGSTGIAAIQLGRSFIGIEREPKYFDIACKRIEQAVAQGQLFEPEIVKQTQESLL
jgi:site-specific DNA-methyltransferase (adenine-specific)/modification methylase